MNDGWYSQPDIKTYVQEGSHYHSLLEIWLSDLQRRPDDRIRSKEKETIRLLWDYLGITLTYLGPASEHEGLHYLTYPSDNDFIVVGDVSIRKLGFPPGNSPSELYFIRERGRGPNLLQFHGLLSEPVSIPTDLDTFKLLLFDIL